MNPPNAEAPLGFSEADFTPTDIIRFRFVKISRPQKVPETSLNRMAEALRQRENHSDVKRHIGNNVLNQDQSTRE